MDRVCSSYLRETAGFFADPLHEHSFQRVHVAALTAIDRSMLFFRDCIVCEQRALWIGRQTRKRKLSGGGTKQDTTSVVVVSAPAAATSGGGSNSTTSNVVCQCLQCGKYIHRDCLSFAHAHRHCRSHAAVLPLCTSSARDALRASEAPLPKKKSFPSLFPLARMASVRRSSAEKKPSPPRLFGNEHLPASFTLSALIEELSRDPSAPSTAAKSSDPLQSKASPTKPSKIARRVAPFLAAGGVIGAIALGPISGVLAGLNVFVAGVGVEAVLAGVGLTAATAAAATVTHQKRARNAKRRLERVKSGEWAMEICWNCKKAYQGVPSDDAFRKDAELLRRFQMPPQQQQDGGPRIPDADEIYAFLFSIFASPSEFLSQVNMQLCAAFRERHQARQKASSSSSSSTISRDTLQDTKMYIAHILGATMQTFPSLASTEQAMAACSQAIERIVYDDIYSIVFREFTTAFADADAIFHGNLDRIRHEQRDRPVSLLYRSSSGGGSAEPPALHEDLQLAEHTLDTMIHRTSSPLRKLDLLCTAFRAICCFADQLHQTASNADILIPIVCSLLVTSPKLAGEASGSKRAFVSEIAFIAFFTNGGGKGVEGYVLTTFQAVIQVIAAVDLSHGPAKELELYMEEEEAAEEEDTEDEEFYDAASGTESNK
ncbi:Vacuolar sorting protein 9, partial [Globisporangium splendens]